jgi:hypothetical protein
VFKHSIHYSPPNQVFFRQGSEIITPETVTGNNSDVIFPPKDAFMGHIVSKDGTAPDLVNIAKVKTHPQPRNMKKGRQFLGLASYYRRLFQGSGQIASPLNDLLKKERKSKWTAKHMESSVKLSDILIAPPILAFPDFPKVFDLQNNTWNKVLGATLSQNDDKYLEHPIAFASRARRKSHYFQRAPRF